MNLMEFDGSKVDEDPNGFIDEVYNLLAIMGVSSIEIEELVSYQLKHVALLLYEQWKDSRPIRAVTIEWETFMSDFLDSLFPRELRDAKEYISI